MQYVNSPFHRYIQNIDKIHIKIPDTNNIEVKREIVSNNELAIKLIYSFYWPF